MGRGSLTPEISDLAKELLDIDDFTVRELRLMPYIQHVMMNGQKIDPRKINAEERTILQGWKSKGWAEGGANGLVITKEFWDAINEICWLAYVC